MKNNPLIPYVLIMAFGIGLIFFMSLQGAGNKDEATEGESGEATAEIDGAAIVQSSCIGCHGGDLGGGMGPALTGSLDAEHVKTVVMNGQGTMPAVITNEAEAQAVADYIAGLE
ncbi:cytochrome c550 [Lysinibacillus sp. KU-BSD001]|uniref:cytochrome c550 n=1 Tax=Lysinibacillus sp. KU-BSD001 TaxID=3141328 RepID=UPI0036E84B6B